jgi:hypothetical protein
MSGHDRCPGCDPILCAGYCRCDVCGRAAYPSDAIWLDGGRLMAFYPAACDHHHDRAWLVTPGAGDAPAEWCQAIASSTGALCRQRARPGSPFCHHHDPARREA